MTIYEIQYKMFEKNQVTYIVSDTMANAISYFESIMDADPLECKELEDFRDKIIVDEKLTH